MVHVSRRWSGPTYRDKGCPRRKERIMNRYGLHSWSEHHRQVLPTQKSRPRRKERIMMRRTVLLVVTTALALVAAGGIALAATFTCTTNPCDGTTDDDVITGTLNAETINGKAGNDEISAQDANDILNGGAGNDDLAGGLGNDRYFVTTNWGSDTIIDGGGNNDFIAPEPDGGATAAALPNLTVNLVSSSGPEYTDGNGNTVNWNDDAIGSVSTGAGDDVISQRPRNSNAMIGGAGNDTYTGYTTDPFGGDIINDPGGTAEVLDLSSRSLTNATWTTPYTSNYGVLRIRFNGDGFFGCSEEICDYIDIDYYFDNTSTDVCARGAGPGVIETIKFADDPSVDFAQVKNLAVSHDRTDNDRDGITDEPDEKCPAPTEEDTTPPPAPVISSPPNNTIDTDGNFTVSGTAEANSTVELFEGSASRGTATTNASGQWSKSLTGVADGLHTYTAKARDAASNTSDPSTPLTVDVRISPVVVNVSPADQMQNVAVSANATATFSEDMDQSTLSSSTFTLTKQGSTSPLAASTVSYDSANKKATLDPASDLEANTSYTATLKGGSTGVKDLAGNALGQDYSWTFTTAAPPAPSCTITGTINADTISGTSGNDVICAGGGNDTLKGLGGNDTLKGEAGNDTLLGGVGDDNLDGSLGTDTASYSASLTAVVASLATNSSTGEGTDTFAGVENLLGSPQADTLTGSDANNTLTGDGGNDTEHGGLGNDSVVGSGGADSLFGDENDDAVNSKDGVKGNDSLDGGSGTDTKVSDATEKSIVGFP
jgi:Ca2+-binding RTX toxin-like protein